MGMETKSVVLPSQADAVTLPLPGERSNAAALADAAVLLGRAGLPAFLTFVSINPSLLCPVVYACLHAERFLAASSLHMCTGVSMIWNQ